jgi:Phage tail tube protein, GTA-gp10
MMINSRRGEISAKLNGKQWRLCLTLGALAQLESAFEVSDLAALGERFSSGKLSSHDMMAVITAGLNGGGHELTMDDVARMHCDSGLAGFADIVARLLLATFAAPAAHTAKTPPLNP